MCILTSPCAAGLLITREHVSSTNVHGDTPPSRHTDFPSSPNLTSNKTGTFTFPSDVLAVSPNGLTIYAAAQVKSLELFWMLSSPSSPHLMTKDPPEWPHPTQPCCTKAPASVPGVRLGSMHCPQTSVSVGSPCEWGWGVVI